jgi:uncharacterized protein (DUF924 family)
MSHLHRAGPRWSNVAAASDEGFVELESYAGRSSTKPHRAPTGFEGEEVVSFWREAGPDLWFAKDPAFDRRFRERFLPLHEEAVQGAHAGWLATASGALGLVLLLDQFPRNAFRGTARMYRADAMARETAAAAIGAGLDRAFDASLRLFFCLPFGHSENLHDQERSVALAQHLGEPHLTRARHHHDIIRRFGRFPHRNPILGRVMTPEEQHFLDNGGYAG